MSDKQPFPDDQWNDLPLPDGDAAWQRMEVLLDEDDRKRRVLPWWFWRYGATGLLLVGLALGGWLWLQKENKQRGVDLPSYREGLAKETLAAKENPVTKKAAPVTVEKAGPALPPTTSPVPGEEAKAETPGMSQAQTLPSALKVAVPTLHRASAKQKQATRNELRPAPQTAVGEMRLQKADSTHTNSRPSTSTAVVAKPVGADSIATGKTAKKDTAVAANDTAKVLPPPAVVQKTKKKVSAFTWSAGIGMQRAIALPGQGSSSYNYSGRRSGLSDNIPSAYLRLQKGKWYLQAEGNYAVPQPVKNFSFSQQTRYDAAALSLNTERFIIQKLYYHQLPVSVNYHFFPQWSVGAGGVYNILAGAVTQQEVTRKDVQTTTEQVSRSVAPVKGFKDSFLYKTTAGLLLQTDYHWKRFSFGLRYVQNLQPFIKYTKPDGEVLDEKNRTLQAVVRFRLWRSN